MLQKPLYGRVLFDPDKGKNPPAPNASTDTTPDPGTPPKQGDGPTITLTQADLDARMAAARKDGKTAAERAAQDAKDADAAARALADQESKGQYEAAKAALEGKVTTAEGRATAAETERDALATYFDGQYKAAMTDLPEFVTAFAPADDASFAEKSAWLTKAQEQAAKVGGETKPGNRPNPKPGGDGNGIKEATEQMRGRVSI